jgi:hypothetical protein
VAFVQGGSYGNAGTFQIALGDLDGDGDLDAVFANMGMPNQVWLNDGNGRFADSGQELGRNGHGVGVGDLDGDGDLDVLLMTAGSSAPSRIFLNDGSSRFAPADGDLGDRGQPANFVSLFDFEGDGDLDAAAYYAGRYEIVYVNDGAGRFAPLGPPIPGMAYWGDLDGDGDADAVVHRFEGGYVILRNVGDGALEEAGVIGSSLGFGIAGTGALGDIDRDGDLDLVEAIGRLTPETPLTVLRNDRADGFVLIPQERFLTGVGHVVFGDLDGDGALDALIPGLRRPAAIALNDGAGGFTDSGVRLDNGDIGGVAAAGDLDGDGDLDLFIAQYDPRGPNTVWLNQGRGGGAGNGAAR